MLLGWLWLSGTVAGTGTPEINWKPDPLRPAEVNPGPGAGEMTQTIYEVGDAPDSNTPPPRRVRTKTTVGGAEVRNSEEVTEPQRGSGSTRVTRRTTFVGPPLVVSNCVVRIGPGKAQSEECEVTTNGKVTYTRIGSIGGSVGDAQTEQWLGEDGKPTRRRICHSVLGAAPVYLDLNLLEKRLSLETPSETPLRLQSSTDLRVWSDLGTGSGTDGTVRFQDGLSGNRFYRFLADGSPFPLEEALTAGAPKAFGVRQVSFGPEGAAFHASGSSSIEYAPEYFPQEGALAFEIRTLDPEGWILDTRGTGARAVGDAVITLNGSGRVFFAIDPVGGQNPSSLPGVTSTTAVNDGRHHEIEVGYGLGGLWLAVDGRVEAENPSLTTGLVRSAVFLGDYPDGVLLGFEGHLRNLRTRTAAQAFRPETPCPGGELLARHAYSVCTNGFWHVVEDQWYACPPEGAARRFRIRQDPTLQTCDQPRPSPRATALGRWYQPFDPTDTTCKNPRPVGELKVFECPGTTWTVSYYVLEQCEDGSLRLRTQPSGTTVTQTPCTEPPPREVR